MSRLSLRVNIFGNKKSRLRRSETENKGGETQVNSKEVKDGVHRDRRGIQFKKGDYELLHWHHIC